MADILGEVVVKSKMKTASESDTFAVIDISMGGLLANTKNVYLARSYNENAIVKLGLSLNDKQIEVTSRIVRYDYIPGENAGLNIAFEFLSLNEETKADIGNFIRNFLKLSVKSEAAGANS
ncbi:MAG: PilZ domain-containing protein [Brevinematales bacterium]|nr:PilZ domain-containing protein [Brevinematales bacterium]